MKLSVLLSIVAVLLVLALAGGWAMLTSARHTVTDTASLPAGDFFYEQDLEALAGGWGMVEIWADGGPTGRLPLLHEPFWTPATGLSPIRVQRRFGELKLFHENAFMTISDLPAGADLELRFYGLKARGEARLQKLAPYIFADDFGRETLGATDGWEIVHGHWQTLWNKNREAVPNQFVAQGTCTDTEPAIILTGADFWTDYDFQVSIKLREGSKAGVIVAWQDPGQCKMVPLETYGRSLLPNNWYRLRVVSCFDDGVQVFIDGEPLSGVEFTPSVGRIGLCVTEGTASFDDLVLDSTRKPGEYPEALQPLQAASVPYSAKPRYEKDDRDDHLDRWAKDADAWRPAPGGEGWYRFHLPLFQQFTVTGRGSDVRIVDAAGQIAQEAKTLNHELPLSLAAAGPYWIEYRPGTAKASPPLLAAQHVWQEFFEQAPAKWLAIDGDWEMTNRWQCENRWGFYGGVGPDAVVQFSKPTFSGDQVHEFYYGMKDLFGREYKRHRYARHDVNLSIMTDGRNLFSGYTFMLGGYDNTASYLYRRGEMVATNTEIKFEPFVDIDDLHLYWRRLRMEALGGHIRVLLDDQVVIDYEETDLTTAPRGGQVALWTYRNGIVYGRFNSSAEGSEAFAPIILPHTAKHGMPLFLFPPCWQSLQPGRVIVEGDWVFNQWGGGAFAVNWPLDDPVELKTAPVMKLQLAISEGAKVNLHLVVSGKPLIVPLTAPTTETYRVLGFNATYTHAWDPYAMEPLAAPIIAEPASVAGGIVTLDLLAIVQAAYPELTAPKLQSLIIGNTDHSDYLMAGLSGNQAWARYKAGKPVFRTH